jgi:catechol 2,3-dioxygenase-like lactoylglutathione lyase family enzyme
MTPAVQEMVAATYVRDIDVSRSFYELLGFAEDSTGRAATSGWSALQQDGYLILLASTTPPLDLPQLPLLFYFFFDEVDSAIARLRAGGVDVIHMGHPPHALGGEAKLLDPDGNTVLLGQRERSASQPPQADDSAQHFSLLKEAAALVSASGGAKTSCQVNDVSGAPCRQKADVKLADAAGDSAWACLDHADEILVTVRGAFIATQADEGIASFLARRRR